MITGNEPAMPVVSTDFSWYQGDQNLNYSNVRSKGGLTIRQQFAAMAMQGLLSNSDISHVGSEGLKDAKSFVESYASSSVAMADALIAELNK